MAENFVQSPALDVELIDRNILRAQYGCDFGGGHCLLARNCPKQQISVRFADRFDTRNAAGIRKRSDRCVGAVCNDLQRHRAVIVHALHQVVGRAICYDHALVDDDGARAHRLDLFENVSRNDDRLVGGHVGDELADVMLLIGVEAVGRLVHDQNRRVVQDRLREADAALVALRQRVDHLLDDGLEAGAFD